MSHWLSNLLCCFSSSEGEESKGNPSSFAWCGGLTDGGHRACPTLLKISLLFGLGYIPSYVRGTISCKIWFCHVWVTLGSSGWIFYRMVLHGWGISSRSLLEPWVFAGCCFLLQPHLLVLWINLALFPDMWTIQIPLQSIWQGPLILP